MRLIRRINSSARFDRRRRNILRVLKSRRPWLSWSQKGCKWNPLGIPLVEISTIHQLRWLINKTFFFRVFISIRSRRSSSLISEGLRRTFLSNFNLDYDDDTLAPINPFQQEGRFYFRNEKKKKNNTRWKLLCSSFPIRVRYLKSQHLHFH